MIILDMDGVICDFHTGFCKVWNLDPLKLVPGKWDFKDAFPQLSSIANADLYKELEFDFWSNLEWMHDGKAILELLESRVGQNEIVLWSSPTHNSGCIPGKLEWIKRNLHSFYWNRVIIGPMKEIGANTNNILIDDHDLNISKFRLNGGKTVIVPRLWNSHHTALQKINAISYIELQMDLLGL